MTFVEHVHCSRCGKRCSGVDPEMGLIVRAWVECPECVETLSAEAAARGQLPQRLHAAIQGVIRETRGFNERKQEAWCRVCRYKDPLATKLHDPECPIYELHGAWEEALAANPPSPKPPAKVPPEVAAADDGGLVSWGDTREKSE